MPVASSSFALDAHTQADGRRYVRETHQLTVGAPVIVDYLAAAGTDYAAVMAARVAQIDASLAGGEYRQNVDGDRFSTLHLSVAELAARFRAEYLAATSVRACQMAYWLLERIAAGNFTDVQARNAFGLNATQWNNLKTNRLTPQHDAWAAVLAATGA